MWEEEINYYEKLFEKDSREKKRIARGASARASRKKGFKGGVRTPSDFMTKKWRILTLTALIGIGILNLNLCISNPGWCTFTSVKKAFLYPKGRESS